MKTLIVVPLTCLVLAAGCASSDKVRQAESTSETNQKVLRETDHRLRTLEQSVNTLDTQVAQLNNRVYEVRTRGGQKTGMTVVPIIPPQPYKSAVATPAQPDAQLTAHGPVAVPTAEFAAGQQVADQAANSAGNGAGNQVAASQNAAQASGRPSIAVASTSATPGTTPGSAASSAGSSSTSRSGGVPVIGSASNSSNDPAATIRPIPAAPQREAANQVVAPAPHTAAQPVSVQPTPAEKPLTKAEAKAIAKAEAKAAAEAAKAEAAAAKAAAKPAAPPASSTAAATSFALPPEAAKPAKPATAMQPMLPPVAAAGGNTDVPVPVVPQSDLALPPEIPGLGLPPLPGEAAAGKSGTPQNGAKGKPTAKAAATPAPAAPAPIATSETPAPAQSASLPKSGKGEEAAYKAALQPAMAGRPAESIGRFQTFLQEYPKGRFAANAEYWIGEGLYAQGKYGEALAQFQKVNSQWPSHHKNADALLKTGMTLSRMGDKDGAAQAYKKLLSQFPGSEAAGIARSRGLAR